MTCRPLYDVQVTVTCYVQRYRQLVVSRECWNSPFISTPAGGGPWKPEGADGSGVHESKPNLTETGKTTEESIAVAEESSEPQAQRKRRGNEKWFTRLGVSPSDSYHSRSYLMAEPPTYQCTSNTPA